MNYEIASTIAHNWLIITVGLMLLGGVAVWAFDALRTTDIENMGNHLNHEAAFEAALDAERAKTAASTTPINVANYLAMADTLLPIMDVIKPHAMKKAVRRPGRALEAYALNC